MNNKKILDQLKKLAKIANTIKGEKQINDEFFKKIKDTKGTKPIIKKVKKLYRYFRDPNTSKAKKTLIGAVLLYFIIPVDVVNDFIPVLGYIDDGVAIAYVWSLMDKELENYEANGTIIDITSEARVIDDEEK